MWIFTPFGFFSCVAHREKKGVVIVRARNLVDLRHFAMFIVDASEGEIPNPAVVRTPRADYSCRFEVSSVALGRALDVFVREDLEYDNFKDEVAKTDLTRARLYHEVWHVLREGLR